MLSLPELGSEKHIRVRSVPKIVLHVVTTLGYCPYGFLYNTNKNVCINFDCLKI